MKLYKLIISHVTQQKYLIFFFFFFKGEESQRTGRNRKIMIATPHPCVLFLIVFANDWLRMIGTRTHGRAGETQEISVTCV